MQTCKSQKGKVWVILVGLLLLVGAVVFSFFTISAPKPGFHASLIGMTNEPTLGHVALFSVTNFGGARLFLHVGPPQFKQTSGWSPVQPPEPAGMVIEKGDAQIFQMPVPVESGTWRVPLYWGYEPTGLRRLAAIGRYNWNLNRIRLQRGRSLVFIRSPQTDVWLAYGPEVSM